MLLYCYDAKVSDHIDTKMSHDEGTQLSTTVENHGRYQEAPNRTYSTTFDDKIAVHKYPSDVGIDDKKISNCEGGHSKNRRLNRQVRVKLLQLRASDVDAVFADSEGAVNSLRDVQVCCRNCGTERR